MIINIWANISTKFFLHMFKCIYGRQIKVKCFLKQYDKMHLDIKLYLCP